MEILLIRTKSTGTDFCFRTNGRFSNPENSLTRKYRPGTNVSGLTNHHCTCVTPVHDICVIPVHDTHVTFQASKWCSQGVDMLSVMQTEQCHSIEESRKALQAIEEFMATSSQLRLNNPKEFRQLFETMITPETRVSFLVFLNLTPC